MCIRDSAKAKGEEATGVIQREFSIQQAVTAVRVGQEALEPVSYTHLRAHETVLDLVCRLLLEKKKDEDTYSNIRKHIEDTRL